jgi:hypothetical protein
MIIELVQIFHQGALFCILKLITPRSPGLWVCGLIANLQDIDHAYKYLFLPKRIPFHFFLKWMKLVIGIFRVLNGKHRHGQ